MEEEKIWEGILEKAEKTKTDLIVLGTKGDSPLRKFCWVAPLPPSYTTLIEKAKCPVLAIPPKTKYNDLDRIVYAS